MRRTVLDAVRRLRPVRQQISGRSTAGIIHGRRPRYSHDNRTGGKSTAIDVARFGLLSVVTLPFSLWIARFSYDYVYRVELCQDALVRDDEDISGSHHGRCFGRKGQLAEAKALLRRDPLQIMVIAGANEVGKSRFVAELLRRRRNVTSIQLAQLVDSVSSLAQVLVDGFGLRWLRMRHMLVDVLPFAGSEILVMKERFSDRDLEQALRVVTEALKKLEASQPPSAPKPVIVIDDLGEGDSEWMRSREGHLCLQRLLQWCVYVTKERRLAHIILTGNEELVFSLTAHNRKIRGHIKVIGLRQLEPDEAAEFVAQELPDATPDEVKKLTETFGGWIHDLRWAIRDVQSQLDSSNGDNVRSRSCVLDEVIKTRMQQQMERITTAFSRGAEKADPECNGDENGEKTDADDGDMDPFLDPLKSSYSEQANQPSGRSSADTVSWTPLQLWRTLHRIVDSDGMAVSFTELRDDVFEGNSDPILHLMKDDVLGFEVGQSADGGTAWYVTPATPALGRAFRRLLAHGDLSERFREMERAAATRRAIREAELGRLRLRREGEGRERRKASLRSAVELGEMLGREDRARRRLASVYDSIVAEEATHEARDRELRGRLESLRGAAAQGVGAESSGQEGKEAMTPSQSSSSMQRQMRSAVLSILAREDPSLTKLKESDRLLRLEAAFRELDSSKRGGLTVEDVARLISSVTGDDVDLEAAHSLVNTWDLDNSGHLEYEEFVHMLGMEPAVKKPKATT